jgi:hypothetical protein
MLWETSVAQGSKLHKGSLYKMLERGTWKRMSHSAWKSWEHSIDEDDYGFERKISFS